MATYRELGEPDLDAYYRILHEGYQTDKKYPISFAAMTATREQERAWLMSNPTYGLFEDGERLSARSLCACPGGQIPVLKVYRTSARSSQPLSICTEAMLQHSSASSWKRS